MAELDRLELVKLMKKYKLRARRVAEITGVKEQTVRAWRAGLRNVPEYALKLINLTCRV